MLKTLPNNVEFFINPIDKQHEYQLSTLSDFRFKQTSKMSSKRRLEFFSGRWCAAQCLKRLQSPSVDVAIAPDRSPIWPLGIIGSISHSDNYAVCIASSNNHARALGLDLQSNSSAKLANELSPIILHPNEFQSFWKENQHPDNTRLFDLIFSAKETLYKALYPLCSIFFDHQCAEVIHIDWAAGELEIKLLIPLGQVWRKNECFTIHFSTLNNELITSLHIA